MGKNAITKNVFKHSSSKMSANIKTQIRQSNKNQTNKNTNPQLNAFFTPAWTRLPEHVAGSLCSPDDPTSLSSVWYSIVNICPHID